MRLFAPAAGILVSAAILAGGGSSASAQTQTSETVEPEASKKVEVVKPGDSLTKIAKKHDTTYPRLFDANLKIEHPDVIYPGDEVRIPHENEKLEKRPLPGVEQPAAEPKQPVPTRQSSQPIQAVASYIPGNSVWDRLAQCESGGNWAINTGNGYYGGLQFTLSTWRGVGGSGYPHQASKAEQIQRAEILQARSGWGQWPACSAKLGLR